MSMSRRLALMGAVVCFLASSAKTQWLNYPTPGIPRTKDGKPNLSAAAPKASDGRPDLTGIWGDGAGLPRVEDVPLQPAARATVEEFLASRNNKDALLARCMPNFMLQILRTTLFKFVQTPGLIVMLFEGGGMPLPRQIFLDGRPLPKNPDPSWMGYSVGRWEGSSLVVETIGFHDRGAIPGGIPMTELTRVLEQYERTDFGHLKVRVRVEDPNVFTKPWTYEMTMQYQPDTELLEYVCEKNEDILRHMVGDR